MTTDGEAEALLAHALEQDDPTSFVLARAAERPDLVAAVLGLLDSRQLTSRHFVLPTSPAHASLLADLTTTTGELAEGARLGPYRLVEVVGRGGQGTVYRAERADGEFSQTVAIKVAHHTATREQLDRLRAERQTLIDLRHPNIVHFIDGGSTPDGLPFFVVEYIDGEDILTSCQEKHLSLCERLRLFQRVLGAVSAAHRASVIHCDLKPSNILIDAQGEPRLCDFGVARVLAPLSDTPAVGLTFPYAPPEQLRRESVTTTTDVYALGVILYELLTARRPIELTSTDPDEWLQEIAKQDIAPPSRLFQKGGAECDLRRSLRADLDAIVLRALAPAPEDRYASVEALGEDIERLLTERPVHARRTPPPALFAKFARRHRIGVIAALLAAASLVSYTILLGVQRERAEQAAAQAEALVDTMSGVLQLGDPDERLGADITVEQLLERTRAEAEQKLKDQPVALARLLTILSRSFGRLNNPKVAEELARRALTLADRAPKGEQTLRALATAQLGHILAIQQQYDEADALLQRALAVLEEEPAQAREVGGILDDLANIERQRGKIKESCDTYERALHWRVTHLGPNHPDVAGTLSNLALGHKSLGNYQRAQDLLQRALQIDRRALGEKSTRVGRDLGNIASVLIEQGAFLEAIPYLKEAVAIRTALYGPDNYNVALVLTSLGTCLSNTGSPEAEATLKRALAIKRKVLRPTHPSIAFGLEALGQHYHRNEQYAQAEAFLREALAIREAEQDKGNLNTLYLRANLASVLTDAGKYEAASALLDAAIPLMRASGAPLAFLAQAVTLRAHAARGARNTRDCTRFYREAICLTENAIAKDGQSPNARRTRAEALLGLGQCLDLQGQDPLNAWQSARVEAATLLHMQPGDKQALAIRKEAEQLLQMNAVHRPSR